MGLFDRKSKKELPSLFAEDELQPEPQPYGYNEAIDYLTGLSEKDYETVCKVAVIYRQAQADVAATLGIENEPSTFITQPVPEPVDTLGHPISKPSTLLDDDDGDADISAILDDEPGFIEDEVPTSNKPKGNRKAVDIAVKE